MNVWITVNTPRSEFDCRRTASDLNKAVEQVQRDYPDWTSLVITVTKTPWQQQWAERRLTAIASRKKS